MDTKLDGKVAIVTGASSGVGRGVALRLAEEGARVAVVGRTQERVEEAVAELESRAGSGSGLGVCADVSRVEGTARISAAVLERWGRVDILVNNAGEPAHSPFEEVDDDAWHYDFDLKLMAAVRLFRLLAPHLREAGGGSVVSILSTGAKIQSARTLPTTASRAAGLALVNTLSKEFGPDGIRVNAVVLGTIKSGQWEQRWREEGEAEPIADLYARMAASVPLGRVGEPEEVGDLVCFLVSERARYINGAAINLDGGKSPVT